MIRHIVVAGAALAAVVLALPARAHAQRRPTGAAIVIHGAVPTPQVVTVRPREEPKYSRQVLVPQFYNRSFLSDILPGYQLVNLRQLAGGALAGANAGPAAPALELEIEAIRRDLDIRRQRLDSIAASVRRLGSPDTSAAGRTRPPTPPADTTRRPPDAQAARRKN
ncbi:MAG: hypothetical protein M3081_01625 [Gemmatimonadota bacterium]|nr:hypothetical protein [Gemmatimonadota bacterium]